MPQTVALFVPCFIDQIVPEVGMSVVRVLRRIGLRVIFPEDQTCCGQPAFNTGYWDDARPCAERFVRIFSPYEYIVCPSGSCTAMVRKEYPELLKRTPLAGDAAAVGSRVFEFSEFLVRVAGVSDVGATFPHSVTYHASCHATRQLGIDQEPRTLLRSVRGLELREMPHADECCGFGGSFSVKMGTISAGMADSKAEFIATSGAEYVTSLDSSCLLHLEGRLRKTGQRARTIHLASILAQEAQ